jgi:heme exporter protein A
MINIFGKNGTGKTSLLKLISGITSPSSGKITTNVSLNDELFYIGHKYGLKNELTVYDNIRYSLDFHRKDIKDTSISDELIYYDIKDKFHSKVKYLSHGQKKIASLVQLSLLKNKIWVLDEPFTGLDQTIIGSFIKKIELHVADGGAVIITSHVYRDQFTNIEL